MSAQAIVLANPGPESPARADLLEAIRTYGGLLDDLERVRVANGNRIGALVRIYGSALPELDHTQAQLTAIEHETQLQLVRTWRQHPLAPWAAQQRGVGEKSIARLIAVVGDPAERPNVAKLWAYCGVGDPARIRRVKGATQAETMARGNPHARKRCWLIGTRMLMSGNRDQYDARREATRDRGWTLGHAHNDALRIVAKTFLRDLWVAARAVHAITDIQPIDDCAGHALTDPHISHARAAHRSTDAHSRSDCTGVADPERGA